MKAVTISKFDPLDYLKNEQDYEEALTAAFKEDPGDGSLIAKTMGLIAKAKANTTNKVDSIRENEYKTTNWQ